ncbi:MAG TPA: AsmA family protein [Cellvibrio sp.]|nr:AsmA family protein [Cellvibrio sp.]
MKRALKISGFAIGFVISSIIILALLVDANMFKPRITALAKERGIALDMRGDLRWAFWPSVGLAVNDVSIASSDTPDKPVATIEKASFLIAFIPLMQSNFEVKHIIIKGAVINLEVDTQGKGNWEALSKSPQTPVSSDKPRTNLDGSINSSDLHLSIEQISLHDSAISYLDLRKNQRVNLADIQLDIDDVNTLNEPFAMNFSWNAQISDAANNQPLSLKGKLHNRIALSENLDSVELTQGDLMLEIKAKSSAAIAVKYAVKLDKLDSNLEYKGQISLPPLNARTLLHAFAIPLQTANEKALSELGVSAEISGNKQQLALKNIELQLDKTRLKGEMAINDFASQALAVKLQGDNINVDDYLAPKAEAPTPESNSAQTAAPDSPLPLKLLRGLNINSTITFNKMIFSQLALEKIQLDLNAKHGIIQQELSANAYSGSIHEKLNMTAGEKTANLRVESIVRGLQVEPLLKDKKLDKNLHLSGAIEANISAQANGASGNQLFESLVANGNFSGAQVRLAPINVEQQFCQMINLVNRIDTPEKTWNDYTQLRELSGKINIANRIITVESFNAGVEKLQLGTQGNINLATGAYDFMLPLKLIRDANDTASSITTSAAGCTVNSNYWAERSMALLRCKGAYGEINPRKDCRPDKDMLNAVIKDYAEYKLREKHGEKAEAKKAELIKKLDDKLGGEGNTEKARTLLKNIFKKKDEQ